MSKITKVDLEKSVKALSLDAQKATREQLASALLVLNPLSEVIQKQLRHLNLYMELANNHLRQCSMFEDETFSNSVNTVSFTEVTTKTYSVDRAGVLKKVGLASTKYNDFISVLPVVKQKAMAKLKSTGKLDADFDEFIKESSVTQVAMAFGKEEETKEEK